MKTMRFTSGVQTIPAQHWWARAKSKEPDRDPNYIPVICFLVTTTSYSEDCEVRIDRRSYTKKDGTEGIRQCSYIEPTDEIMRGDLDSDLEYLLVSAVVRGWEGSVPVGNLELVYSPFKEPVHQ